MRQGDYGRQGPAHFTRPPARRVPFRPYRVGPFLDLYSYTPTHRYSRLDARTAARSRRAPHVPLCTETLIYCQIHDIPRKRSV